MDDKGDIIEFDSGSYDIDYADATLENLRKLLETTDLTKLQEDNIISSEINTNDFAMARDKIKSIVNSKLVKVD